MFENNYIHEGLFLALLRNHTSGNLVLVLFFIISYFLLIPVLVNADRFVVYPCTDITAVSWVRDRHRCDIYYICQYGQPLTMPACPWGQVWSNAAHNCVPETSRWNDCPASWDSRKSGGKYASYRLTKTMKRKYTTPKRADFTNKIPSNVKISRNDGKPRADKDFWGNLRITAEKPTTRQTTVKTSTVTLRDEDFYYDFWGNKFTSPPTLKNGKSQTLLPSDKNSKHYLVTPDWSSRRKHPHYPNLPTQRNDSRKKSRWFSQFLEDYRSKMLSVEMDGEFGKTTPKDSFYFSEGLYSVVFLAKKSSNSYYVSGLFLSRDSLSYMLDLNYLSLYDATQIQLKVLFHLKIAKLIRKY